MNSRRWRTLALGALLTGLAAWLGLTKWTPTATQAAAALAMPPDEDAAADVTDAELADLASSWLVGLRSGPVQPWPANPFHRADQAAESDTALTTFPTPGLTTDAVVRFPYVLGGILSGARPLALIDGRVVGVGDVLAQGCTVVAIDEYSVTVRQGPQTYVLELSD